MKNYLLLLSLTVALLTVVSCEEIPEETENSDAFSWELVLEKPNVVPIGLQIWDYADFYNDGTFVLAKEYPSAPTDTETFQYSESGNVIRIHNMYGKDWVGTMPATQIQIGNKVEFKEDGGNGYFHLKYLGN